MSRSRFRKVTVHLTPLLDMMLIVFFAQYLEAQQRTNSVVEAATAADQGRDDLEVALANLQTSQQTLTDALAQSQAELDRLRSDAGEQQSQLDAAQDNLEQALARQRVLGELVTQLFQIPEEQINAILDPARQPPISESPEELQRLRDRFRDMAQQDAGPMIRHLLSYEEIRKRCDLWELHIDELGVATFDTGGASFRFRIVPEEFEQKLFDYYKSLPQSKGLVIILLTYDRGSQRIVTRPVQQALPELVARMREDSSGRARFEYADLGVRVE